MAVQQREGTPRAGQEVNVQQSPLRSEQADAHSDEYP